MLLDALMRPGSVEVHHICVEHALELFLMQDEQMIETPPSHATQEALADGIGLRSRIWSFEHLDMTGLGNSIEGHPKLAIVITDEVLRSHSIGCGFSKLLCRPRVSGRLCDAHVDHLPGVQFDDEESEERVEEEIGDRQEVARPDLLSMSL